MITGFMQVNKYYQGKLFQCGLGKPILLSGCPNRPREACILIIILIIIFSADCVKVEDIIRSSKRAVETNLQQKNYHLKQLETRNENSVMLKNINQEHSNERDKVYFNAENTGLFRKPLQRNIDEGLGIKCKSPELLNY